MRNEKLESLTEFDTGLPNNIDSKTFEEYYQVFGTSIITSQKLKLAEHCLNRKVFPLANLILKEFIDNHGPLSEAIFLLAKLRRKMKRNTEALTLFKQLESNPEYKLQGLWGQSMIHQKSNNTDETNRLYNSIISGAANLPIVKESKRFLQEKNDIKLIKAEESHIELNITQVKRVHLHIGAHKSASTTIQRNLLTNRDKVKDEFKIGYIGGGDLYRRGVGKHFVKLAQGYFSDGKDEEYISSIEAAKCSIKELFTSIKEADVVISWEGILGHSALDQYRGIYTHSKRISESLKSIFSDFETEITIVVRRQDDFIESCYLQQIKENLSLIHI